MMTAELTNAEKLRKIHWNTSLNAINTVYAQLTFFGSAFPLFLSELNFSNTEIGFLLSLIPFAALVALFIAPAAARWGYKRTFVTFFGVRKVVTTFLLLVPFVQARFGEQAVLIYVTVVVLAFSLFRSTAETAIWPWSQEYIPNSIRGTYTAINDIVSRLTAMAAIALSSYLLALPLGINRYMLMFGIALIFGWGAVWAASHIPGGAPIKQAVGERLSYRHLVGVLRDKNFSLYLAALSILTLATTPVTSFLPLFMERQIGLSASQVVLLQIGGLVGGLSSTYLLGWASDRYGSKPVVLFGLYLKIILPIAWLLMPRHSDLSLPAALAIAAINGIADIAWAIGLVRLLFVSVVPPEKKTEYMALYYAVAGLAGGVSSVLGGRVLDATAGISGQFLFITLDPFTPLFIGGSVLTVVSVFVFNAVKADSRVSVGEFAGLFIHGNPVLALESMYRYYRARDERTTVMLTERMGVTKSPLTVDELLEALHDPRFNVRFEAVISIARMDTDPHLIEALAQLVNGTELSLSAMAAWALGRMGDESAFPLLRQGLDSDYRSIRGQCARALATLGDASIIPKLLERLPDESDKGLLVAYAAALGKLQASEAIDTMFSVLDSTENEGARMELALSIARITGREQPFIWLVRQSRHDPATTAAQALSHVRKRLGALGNLELIRLTDEAAGLFARDDFAAGTPVLVELVNLLQADIPSESGRKIISGCAARLRQYGAGRREYLILALHTLDVIFHHQLKEPAR